MSVLLPAGVTPNGSRWRDHSVCRFYAAEQESVAGWFNRPPVFRKCDFELPALERKNLRSRILRRSWTARMWTSLVTCRSLNSGNRCGVPTFSFFRVSSKVIPQVLLRDSREWTSDRSDADLSARLRRGSNDRFLVDTDDELSTRLRELLANPDTRRMIGWMLQSCKL